MSIPERLRVYDDELHERRRHFAAIRTPIDLDSERLKRLREQARETQDP
jgi:hypothetical protein